jgi:hypothetical protein
LGPNIFLSTLFSNILSLHSFLTVDDQAPFAHKTSGNISVLIILMFTFIGSGREHRRFGIEWLQTIKRTRSAIFWDITPCKR